jgi:hypothetical protein
MLLGTYLRGCFHNVTMFNIFLCGRLSETGGPETCGGHPLEVQGQVVCVVEET